jgi:PleD family two-component response regulator
MNSKLQLESQIEKGSDFHFILETLFEEEQISTLEKIKKDENIISNPIESLNNNFKILVVDDDEINIFLVKTILKEILPTAFLFEAVNGKEALDVYFKEEPDLIFLDIEACAK